MCDNDAFHDPDFMNQLKLLNEECSGKIPITLYRSSFIKKCNAFSVIGQTKYGELRSGLFGGVSVFLNKKQIIKINNELLNCSEEEWSIKTKNTAWDSQYQRLFGRKFLVSKNSYEEHFGVTGANQVHKTSDTALEPTEYLKEKSSKIWSDLENIYDKKYFV